MIDVDHLVDVLDAGDLAIRTRTPVGMVNAIRQRRSQRIGDQRAFTATGNARDDGEGTERNRQRHIVQVVLGCAGKFQGSALGLTTLLRHGDYATTGKIISSERTFCCSYLLRRSGGYHHTAALTRARTHVNHIISGADGIFVVLDDDNGVAEIAKVLERADKALIVTLVQADGRFIENVKNAHQARADLRSQTDTLRFAAGKGCSSTFKGQVIQAYIDQELQTRDDFLRDRVSNRTLLPLETQIAEEAVTIKSAHLANLVNGLAAHGNREDLRLQAFPTARGARNDGEVTLQLLTLRIALRLLVFAHYRGQGALPLNEPVGVTSIDRGVIHPDLFLPQAFEQSLLDFFGHVLPRGVLVTAHMQCNGFKDLRVVVAALKRRDGTLRQRQRGIGNHQTGIDLFPAADTRTVRTGSVWSVETEVARLKLVHRVTVLGTRQCQGEQMLACAKTAFGAA